MSTTDWQERLMDSATRASTEMDARLTEEAQRYITPGDKRAEAEALLAIASAHLVSSKQLLVMVLGREAAARMLYSYADRLATEADE